MRPDRQTHDNPRSGAVGGSGGAPRETDRQPAVSHVPTPSRGVLNDQLDLSVAEIAVMWILHHATLSPKPRRSLTLEIVEFYPVAFDVISRTDVLCDAEGFDVRLIYFKGLIVARTHPPPQMVDAIRRADRALEAGVLLVGGSDASTKRSAAEHPFEDQRALDHIADALGYSE